MSQLKNFLWQVRRLSTTRILHRPALGPEYKSKALWDERFNCKLLGSDQEIIKAINSKILSGTDLNNLEVDVFINIAAPRQDETAQLTEASKAVAAFRKSLAAHTLLPSTSHALCRLFIESGRLSSIVKMLERRVQYGIFPDFFMLNMLFDQTLEKEDLMLACRLAALIMLQEEFGLNALNDNFALYSVSKYIESKTDFEEWVKSAQMPDLVLEPTEFEQFTNARAEENAKDAKKADEDEDEEEEEEEDAEYIRIPFLRNPYNDKHFDLTNPREICGKTLHMLGRQLSKESLLDNDPNLGSRCTLLGTILLGDWKLVVEKLDESIKSKLACDQSFREAAKFYTENLHGIDGPKDEIRTKILSDLDKLTSSATSLSQDAESRHSQLRHIEQSDIDKLREDIRSWTELRQATKQKKDEYLARQKLIAEIKAKKEELKQREQFLYFYDDLRRKNLTRVDYD